MHATEKRYVIEHTQITIRNFNNEGDSKGRILKIILETMIFGHIVSRHSANSYGWLILLLWGVLRVFRERIELETRGD